MTTAKDFESILDKPATEIDKPKPLPVGEYAWTIQGLPRYDKSKEKQTPFYEFTCKCNGALESVDEEALNEWAAKADGTMRQLTDVTRRLTFYITEDSVYRLQEFLAHCKATEAAVEALGQDVTTRQTIDYVANCQFVGSITHQASNDGTRIYDNIDKTAPIE